MENFYLAYIVNGIIGLAIGYVWGCLDGFKAGKSLTKDRKTNANHTTDS